MVFNPLFLHLGNIASSDGLFLALSMTWFALLLWIIYKPSNKIVCWHAIVLFAVFTVRYNALVYPVIAILAFGLSKLSFRKKVSALGLSLLLIGWFVGLNMFQFKKLTGYWQFSPFSGWLLASNAMYAYREVDSADMEPVPLKFRTLDNMVRNFHNKRLNIPLGYDGIAYMWIRQFPLMQYPDSLFKKDISATPLKKWAGMGPFYSSYGWYLINKYPMHFLRYFIWRNLLLYFTPPVEFLEGYNRARPTVPESAVRWFGYKNNQVKARMTNLKASTLQPFPYLVSITHLMMLLMLLSYLLLKGWQNNQTFNKSVLLAGFAWMVNSGFIIFTCAAALRFEAFPVLLSVIFSLLLIDWMTQLMQHLKRENQQQNQTGNIKKKQLYEF